MNMAQRMHKFNDSGSDSGEHSYTQPIDVFGSEIIGKATRLHKEQMDEIKTILKRVGWMSEGSEEEKPRVPDMVCPEEHHIPRMWKGEVEHLKKEAERENIDVNSFVSRSSADAMQSTNKIQLIQYMER